MQHLKRLFLSDTWVPIIGAAIIFAAVITIVPIVPKVGAVSTLDTDTTFPSSATSTPTFLNTTGADNTSTTTIDTLGVDHVDMNLQLVSSSTATALHWKYEFSHDNIDWFGEDLAQTASAGQVTHSTSTLDHLWEPNNDTASTTAKNIGIPTVASRYMRAIFSVTGNNGSVWAQFTRKKN